MSQHMNTPLMRLQQLESKVAALTNSALNLNREDKAAVDALEGIVPALPAFESF